MKLGELTGAQLQAAMLTLRLTGHEDAANVFQAELIRRAEAQAPPSVPDNHGPWPWEEAQAYRNLGLRKIKVNFTGLGKVKTLTYQTAQDVKIGDDVQVPRWPDMPPGPPLHGTVVSLSSDYRGQAVTIIGG